jgi:DNA-directed RNA polymerase specialized sigma24 family protein
VESGKDTNWFFAQSELHWPWFWVEPREHQCEDLVDSFEIREQIWRAIAELPPGQRAVITLRDLQEWTSEEVCQALGVTLVNQRVLLHRARAGVRTAMTRYSPAASRERERRAKLRKLNGSLVRDAA